MLSRIENCMHKYASIADGDQISKKHPFDENSEMDSAYIGSEQGILEGSKSESKTNYLDMTMVKSEYFSNQDKKKQSSQKRCIIHPSNFYKSLWDNLLALLLVKYSKVNCVGVYSSSASCKVFFC